MRKPFYVTAVCLPYIALGDDVDFSTRIQPVFWKTATHGTESVIKRLGVGPRLDVREAALKGGDSDKTKKAYDDTYYFDFSGRKVFFFSAPEIDRVMPWA